MRSGYHVLGQEGEPVPIHLRDESGYGQILALAVYTSEDGGQQREDLQRYENTELVPMSAEETLALIPSGSCSTVFLDGKKLARSVFVGICRDAKDRAGVAHQAPSVGPAGRTERRGWLTG